MSNLLICFINPQPTCDALAALISCRPIRAPNFYSTLRYFPLQKPCFACQRAWNSSARRLLTTASVNGRRTVVRPSQTVRSISDVDDDRTALFVPSTGIGKNIPCFRERHRSARRANLSASCRHVRLPRPRQLLRVGNLLRGHPFRNSVPVFFAI
jgi:hypothetical protein